jgi:hypothetical protein
MMYDANDVLNGSVVLDDVMFVYVVRKVFSDRTARFSM